jgi:hypothetical protein
MPSHTSASLDEIRGSVLDSMERSDRNFRFALYGAAAAELLLFLIAFAMIDWSDRTERIVFVMSVLSYTIIVLGLAALGAHVTKTAARLAAALGNTGSR